MSRTAGRPRSRWSRMQNVDLLGRRSFCCEMTHRRREEEDLVLLWGGVQHPRMPRLSDCFEQGRVARLALLIALIVPSLNACAPDKAAHSATETTQSGSSTSGTTNVTSGTPTSGTTNTTSGSSTVSGTTNATSGSSTSGTETTNATSDPLTSGTSSATTGGFQWPQYPPVKCGDVLCAEGELCVYLPASQGSCPGVETSGGPDTTTGGMDCDPGHDATYRCEAYPDYCLESPDPLDCLPYYFCGGPCAPFSGGVLECPNDNGHDCTTTAP
jgi:hypothetical protein